MYFNKRIFRSFIAVTAILMVSCTGKNENQSKAADGKPIAVTVGTPSNGTTNSISISGRVEAAQSANISTRMMGYITKVYVKAGDKVQKGQLLFSVNNTDIIAKRSQVDAAVSQAEAAYGSALKDFDRFTTLFKQQSASAKELDNATLQYQSAKATMDAAKQMRNEVNAQLSYSDVTAPFNGVVTQKLMDAGNMATPGMPILAIETNNALQVTASVPESQISLVKLGADATLGINAANSVLAGKVIEISSSSQNSGGMYIVKVSIAEVETGKLFAGMYVNVDIPVADTSRQKHTAGGVFVPVSSIVHKGDLDGIYTVGAGNQALLRWVRLGKNSNDKVELLSGLEKSERFIVHAEGNLYNGAPITITE